MRSSLYRRASTSASAGGHRHSRQQSTRHRDGRERADSGLSRAPLSLPSCAVTPCACIARATVPSMRRAVVPDVLGAYCIAAHGCSWLTCGFAAQPIFWMHHCNVDRVYESCLANELGKTFEEEFRGRLQEGGGSSPTIAFPDGEWGRFEPFGVRQPRRPNHKLALIPWPVVQRQQKGSALSDDWAAARNRRSTRARGSSTTAATPLIR